MLRRRDAGVGKIRFVDINDPSYSPEANAGLSYEQARSYSLPRNPNLWHARSGLDPPITAFYACL